MTSDDLFYVVKVVHWLKMHYKDHKMKRLLDIIKPEMCICLHVGSVNRIG